MWEQENCSCGFKLGGEKGQQESKALLFLFFGAIGGDNFTPVSLELYMLTFIFFYFPPFF